MGGVMGEVHRPNPRPIGMPDGVVVRPNIVVVFDAVTDTIAIVTPVRPEAGVAADTAFERAGQRLAAIVEALDAPLAHSPPRTKAGSLTVWPASTTPSAEYERTVNVAKEYIAAGDILQVVRSQ